MEIKPVSLICLTFLLLTISNCQSDDSDILGDHHHQPEVVEKKQVVESTTNQTTASTQVKAHRRQFNFDLQTLNYYRYEAAAVVCILVYLVSYRRGKAQNYDLMESFYKKIRTYVDNNFSHIGFTKTSGEEPFVGESPNEALFYASGRENVDFLEIKFNMLKRQDLLYHFIYETIYPEKDTIIIDIATTTTQPIVFCIASKKKLRHITDTNIDIAKLAGTFQVKGLNSSYHALSQSSEILDQIFDGNTCKKLNDMSSLIHSIHYSDQKIFSESQGNLRAIFYASQKNNEKYLTAFELLFQIVDKIKGLKLSANEKARAFKARQAFNATKEKEKMQKHKEELRKKKQQKRKQQEAWLRSLPADKQKREDEKRKKKEINRFMKSRVMKVA